MNPEPLNGLATGQFACSAWLAHTVSLPTVICLCSAFWILGLFVGTLITAYRAKKLLGVK